MILFTVLCANVVCIDGFRDEIRGGDRGWGGWGGGGSGGRGATLDLVEIVRHDTNKAHYNTLIA